jgi:hypothetical protein
MTKRLFASFVREIYYNFFGPLGTTRPDTKSAFGVTLPRDNLSQKKTIYIFVARGRGSATSASCKIEI